MKSLLFAEYLERIFGAKMNFSFVRFLLINRSCFITNKVVVALVTYVVMAVLLTCTLAKTRQLTIVACGQRFPSAIDRFQALRPRG